MKYPIEIAPTRSLQTTKSSLHQAVRVRSTPVQTDPIKQQAIQQTYQHPSQSTSKHSQRCGPSRPNLSKHERKLIHLQGPNINRRHTTPLLDPQARNQQSSPLTPNPAEYPRHTRIQSHKLAGVAARRPTKHTSSPVRCSSRIAKHKPKTRSQNQHVSKRRDEVPI